MLNKTFLDYYGSVIKQKKRLKPLSSERVKFLDEVLGGEGYHKCVYDEEIFKLLKKKGINIAERTYFECVFSNMANNTADEARKVFIKFNKKKPKPKPINILEFCTGSGSQTFAFLRKGFRVFTVEKNKQIIDWTKKNFQILNNNLNKKNVYFYNGLLEEFFEKKDIKKKTSNFMNRIDIVYADPPWNNNYYDNMESFSWESMKPSGKIIVENYIKISPIVCIKLPNKMPIELVYDLAKELNLHAVIVNQQLVLSSRKLKEKVAFFIKNGWEEQSILEVRHNKL